MVVVVKFFQLNWFGFDYCLCCDWFGQYIDQFEDWCYLWLWISVGFGYCGCVYDEFYGDGSKVRCLCELIIC